MGKVVCEHVEKRFGPVVAVQDFNLDIQDNEFIVIVGPSGCGKSTLLRMIAGLEHQTAGNIYIGGQLVNNRPPRERNIAMVFQNYALYPHMNVYDNLAFALRMHHMPKDQIAARVREAAAVLGISEYLQRKPRELSGGQRQRVALGRAIVREPAVFLMDEPLSNLDAKLRVQMRTEITKLHKRLHATTIYVTHDQVEAMTMADRIVVMKNGVVQQIATPQAVYDSPANQFVAGFIGTPPMNFLPCRVQAGPDGPRLVGEDLSVTLPPARHAAVAALGGAPLQLGVRPEHMALCAGAMPHGTATVEVVEPMGAENFLYVRLGKNLVVMRVAPSCRPAVGEKIGVTMALDKIHLFAGGDGTTIF